MSQLAGKVALVTGASRGIGAAIAKRLAQDGATVAITYATSPEKAEEVVKSIEAAGGQALAIQADSGDPAAVKGAVAFTAAKFGRLDILVNNAGVAFMAPIGEFPEEQFERLLAVNVRGVFSATKEAVRHMGDGGRIIMIGSINGDFVPFTGGSVYALTKAAISGFTRGLARDLGPRGITVNNLQPGPVDTDLNPAGGPNAAGLKAMMALQRFGQVSEIAALVSLLAGPEGGYITGASLNIDGGFSA
ncbi:3-oxoacyl-ACP reductase family protein [Paludibaculum fermentans]|uniref:3-oxoacyl-ACP reductase family protein n=1 Tax=Paludibaculum fermentans TaxID=1473598 RepID=UPI003EB973CB